MFLVKRIPKKRNYEEESKRTQLKAATTDNHPLKILMDNQAQLSNKDMSRKSSKSSVTSYSDPLSDPLSLASQDPLSKMVADVTLKEKVFDHN